ncbi:MAG: 50S ribosomal protein L25 [Bacteroidales bacterium]
MKTVSMSGSPRESVGKKDAKRQRAEGRVPCVLYGGEEQVHFSAGEKAFHKILHSPDTFFINLTIGEKSYRCILKDIQFHPVSDSILHADFYEVSDDKPITLHIPVKLTGTAPGVIKGGSLVKQFRKLPVEALPGDMPEAIVLNIGKLEILDKILISQIPQDKFMILERPEKYAVMVKVTRVAASTETEEEGEEEVMAEGEGEGEGEGETKAASAEE